jgi:hypothetical protein
MVLYQLENMATCSILNTQNISKVCIFRDLRSLAFLTSVSQVYFRSTMVCWPCYDWSRITRSSFLTCAKMSVGIDSTLRACSPSKLQYSSTVLWPTRADFRNPQYDLGWNHASRSSFSCLLCICNKQEHETASACHVPTFQCRACNHASVSCYKAASIAICVTVCP